MVEARLVKYHDAITTIRYLEEEIIYRFGMPKFIFINNGSEWMAEFDLMCKKHGIIHQFTAPQWPQCIGMVEKMIETLKNGLSVVSSIDLDN